LPLPTKTRFSGLGLLKQITQLFESTEFELPEADLQLYGDQEQLQQVLINLFKNAHEANIAANQSQSKVNVNWSQTTNSVNISVIDHGTGIHNPENLFVPFYTTKMQGSGIGVTLSRQIALNHGGDLTLQNTASGNAKANLSIPLVAPS
jgi:C4-dicarboxylate-specific signal transduction histidine kinase